jgi:hypothetical protein
MSDPVQDFIQALLTTEPQAPHSVQLVVDTDGDMPALFEVLLTVMIGILKKWYPAPIRFGRISESHLDTLKAYFKSFGMKISIDETEEPRVLRIDNKAYEHQQRLDKMTFQTTDGGMLYTVTFGFAPYS